MRVSSGRGRRLSGALLWPLSRGKVVIGGSWPAPTPQWGRIGRGPRGRAGSGGAASPSSPTNRGQRRVCSGNLGQSCWQPGVRIRDLPRKSILIGVDSGEVVGLLPLRRQRVVRPGVAGLEKVCHDLRRFGFLSGRRLKVRSGVSTIVPPGRLVGDRRVILVVKICRRCSRSDGGLVI